MKVLYIGYYREDSDWGRQTVNQILALEKAGVDIVCRSIDLGGSKRTPESIGHLEDKDVSNADYCIQHVFPEHMVGSNKFKKNVGYFTNNFVNIKHSTWIEKLSLMDEVWMPYKVDYTPFVGINSLKFIPFAFDISIFNKRHNNINIKEAENTFKVYSIANPNEPGLDWLLTSFHSEFDVSEPVSLVILVKTESIDGKQELAIVNERSQKIKSLLRLYPNLSGYKRDIIIASPSLTQENIFELHQYCDCYVSTSTQALFPTTEIEAAGFGNNPIVSDKSVILQYLPPECRRHVPSIYQVLQTRGGVFPDTNNGRDYYIRPDEHYIKMAMRTSYKRWIDETPMKHKINNKTQTLNELSKRFSLESVGQKMKEALSV